MLALCRCMFTFPKGSFAWGALLRVSPPLSRAPVETGVQARLRVRAQPRRRGEAALGDFECRGACGKVRAFK